MPEVRSVSDSLILIARRSFYRRINLTSFSPCWKKVGGQKVDGCDQEIRPNPDKAAAVSAGNCFFCLFPPTLKLVHKKQERDFISATHNGDRPSKAPPTPNPFRDDSSEICRKIERRLILP